jgi:transcriptional regulator
MYSPGYNQLENRAELLVTGTGGALHASHLPAMVQEVNKEIILDMHMARANPQWKEFFDDEVLAVFSGAHGYVSPRWYLDKERVPTWNYAAVHAYGVPRIIPGKENKHASQRRLISHHDPEWLPQFDALRKEYVEMMLDGIVNFEIRVTRIETRWKLSQNRGRKEMELIAAALEKSGGHGDKALAELTRKHLVDD